MSFHLIGNMLEDVYYVINNNPKRYDDFNDLRGTP
jgi:hypothetical protein